MAITINGSTGITSSEIADGTITSTKIADGTIVNADINSSAAIAGTKVDGSFGKVLQVVNYHTGALATGTTQVAWDDTIPQNDEGDEYMSLAITPTSATSKLLIRVQTHGSFNSATTATTALFQDSTAGALSATGKEVEVGTHEFNFTHYMTAGTTSATTFKVRAGSKLAGTYTFNGFDGGRRLAGVIASSITITEIAG